MKATLEERTKDSERSRAQDDDSADGWIIRWMDQIHASTSGDG